MRKNDKHTTNKEPDNTTSVMWVGSWRRKNPYCINCSHELVPGDTDTRDNYCSKCGKKIEWVFPRGYEY